MVGFTIPLTIFGSLAAKEFQKIEEQAVAFRRVYGDMFSTEADTEKALKNVRQLADEFTKYGISVEKTIGLAAKVAQMGNVGTALEAQVTQATRLSVLGGIEQQEALDTTISLTNAFGIVPMMLADLFMMDKKVGPLQGKLFKIINTYKDHVTLDRQLAEQYAMFEIFDLLKAITKRADIKGTMMFDIDKAFDQVIEASQKINQDVSNAVVTPEMHEKIDEALKKEKEESAKDEADV
jgi:hypothetical protein